MTLSLLWLALPILTHLVFDTIMQHVDKIRHWLSATIVTVTSFMVGCILRDCEHTWWMGFILSLCVHLALFNLVWNLCHHEYWAYTGTPSNPNRSLYDRANDYIPIYARPLLWAWFVLLGVGVYFRMDLIVGYHINFCRQ